MSAFNILVLVVAVIAAAMGFRRGLIAQAGQIIALLGGIMACRLLGPHAVVWLGGDAPATATDTAIAYALTFLVTYGIILLAAHLVRGAVRAVHLGVLDRLAGAVFKLGVWMLILSVILNVWAAVAPDSELTDTRKHPARAHVMKIAPAVCGYVMDCAAQNSHSK